MSTHDSKFLANPPLPNSSTELGAVSTTLVGTVDIVGVGVTDEAGSTVAVGLIAVAAVYVDVGTGIEVGTGVEEGTAWRV